MKMLYVQINDYDYFYNNKIGRIFSNTSIAQHIPRRDIRFLLFSSGYVDVDIINSHLSILMEFCISNNIKVIVLKMLTNQKEFFYDTVKKEVI